MGADDLMDAVAALPLEIRGYIYNYTCLRTRLQHQQYAYGNPMTLMTRSLLWVECLSLQAASLVRLLPSHAVSWELLMVHTTCSPALLREVKKRLKRMRAESTLVSIADGPDTCSAVAVLDGGRSSSAVRPITALQAYRLIRKGHGIALVRLIEHASHIPHLQRRHEPYWPFLQPQQLLHLQQLFGKSMLVDYPLPSDTPVQRSLLLMVAAATGNLAVVNDILLQDIVVGAVCSAIHLASINAHMNVLHRLCRNKNMRPPSIAGAVRGGHLSVVQYLCNRYPAAPAVDRYWIEYAVMLDRRDILEWVVAHMDSLPSSLSNTNINPGILTIVNSQDDLSFNTKDTSLIISNAKVMQDLHFLALKHNNIAILGHLPPHVLCGPVSVDQLITAISNDVSLLRLVCTSNINATWCPEIMDAAAAKGCLAAVEFLHFNRTEGCTTVAMDLAAAKGHLSVVQFLHLNRTEGCTTDALDNAVINKCTGTIQFLVANRTEGCTAAAMDSAAATGRLDIVTLLHTLPNTRCTTNAVDLAAANGHLDIVEFLMVNRSERCTSAAVNKAIAFRHFDIVWYLLESSAPLTTETITELLKCDQLDCVQVLYSSTLHPRPDWASLRQYALQRGSFKVSDWLKKQLRKLPKENGI
ncbi:hypothetical protein BASA61_009285 [Batrachochytrium salamandrivorans]|nr:hypothetical protein BASA61_009285 [Batrachochytrium salamandrivorans]KAH9251270.1 hypothetical protein BASA81_010892 [Batrachochytrium salamandrivorans]